MASKYYDDSGKEVFDGDVALASDLNTINSAVDSGFQVVESDLEETLDDIELYTDLAEKWAENPEDTQVEAGKYSALHWAAKATAQASAASSSASTATTQAGLALISANTATSQANTATSQANISTAQANIATAQAVIATNAAASSIAMTYVDDAAALQAYTGSFTIAYIQGRTTDNDGGQGVFIFDDSDLSTEVTADTLHGVYVPPNSDNTGASGSWVRQHTGDIDVRWFGVKNDGTDVSSNLLAASNFLQYLGGGRMIIPFTSGTILATGRCNLTSLSNVEIVSYGATIKVPNSTVDTVQTPAGAHSIFRFDLVDSLILRGLKLNGNISNRTALVGSESHNCNIRVTGCQKVRIIDCDSTEAMTDGIYIGDGSTGSASEDVVISGCTIDKSRRNNISGVGQNVLVIEKNDISLAGSIQGTLPKAGIDIEPNVLSHSSSVKILGNTIYENEGMGITVGGQGTIGIDIESNTLTENADVGINIENGNSSVRILKNNIVDGGGDMGIRVVGTGTHEIIGNKVSGCTIGAGISGLSSNGIIIKDNIVTNNYAGIYTTTFTKVEVTGNTILDNGTNRGFYGTPVDVNSIVIFSNNIVGSTLSTGDQQKGAELSANCVDLAVGNFFKNILTDNNYLLNFLNTYGTRAPDAGI